MGDYIWIIQKGQLHPMTNEVLTDILHLTRFHGSVFFNSSLSAPWGLSMETTASPRFHILLDGTCFLKLDFMKSPLQVRAGEIVLLMAGNAHWLADMPNRQLVPSAEAVEASKKGSPLFRGVSVDTHLLCGCFGYNVELPHPLYFTLPSLIHIRTEDLADSDWLSHLSQLLCEESMSNDQGAGLILDRLCELLFIKTIRAAQDIQALDMGFVAAMKDERIHAVLGALHAYPEKPWTLEGMAEVASLSRSAFADRFRKLVG